MLSPPKQWPWVRRLSRNSSNILSKMCIRDRLKGEKLVSKGQVVTAEQVEALQALRLQSDSRILTPHIGLFILVILCYLILYFYLKFYEKMCIRDRALAGRPVSKDNHHLTLAFIGESNAVEELSHCLDIAAGEPFQLIAAQLGAFHRSGGDIIWLGIKPQPELFALHGRLTTALKAAGFAVENRPFKPHLTLLRQAIMPDDFDFRRYTCLLYTSDNHASGQDSDILQHSFAAIAKARSFNSNTGEGTAQFVED